MEISADRTLDARGLNCPLPLIKTKKALQAMESGQIIEVLGTDPASKKDISDFSRQNGHQLLKIEEDPGGFYRFFLRKG